MLQIAPDLLASLLTQWWILVGQNGVVPEDWNTGIMVPLFKKGEQRSPFSYRPLWMPIHVRKIIEKVVVEKLEEITVTDRMKSVFQARINTLMAEVDISAKLETSEYILPAIMDLTKAYDKVSRQILLRKPEHLGVPTDLINQIMIFLLPLTVSTAGDVTKVTDLLTIGLTQGETASPALFRIYINDLASRLRKAAGRNERGDDPPQRIRSWEARCKRRNTCG